MSVTSPRRRRLDRAVALAIVVVMAVAGLILYLRSDFRAASLDTGVTQPVPTPATSTPPALTTLWRATTDRALGAVISPAGVVVTTDPHGITALDVGTGALRWSYQRDNRELCSVGSGDTDAGTAATPGLLHGVVAVYRHDDTCTDVQSFAANDGARGRVRTSPLEAGGELQFGGNAAGWWAPTLVEVWRNNLNAMIRYGIEPNPKDPGTQHLGCTFTDLAIALDQFATIEHCPDRGANARVTLHYNDPHDKRDDWSPFRFEPRMAVDTGSAAAVIVGITMHRVLVLVNELSPALVLYDAAGTEISRTVVPVTAQQILDAATGRPLPRTTTAGGTTYALVGDTILALRQDSVTTPAPATAATPPPPTTAAPPDVQVESLSLRFAVPGARGLPVEMGGELLVPVDSGLLVLDLDTGDRVRSIPVDRGDWSGPVQLGVVGATVVEVRGSDVVAYGSGG